MTEHTELITIRYEMHNGDATKYALEPTPNIGIYEVLQARLIDGRWEVSSTDPVAHKSWIGHGRYKQEAIFEYLKARLGMIEEKQ